MCTNRSMCPRTHIANPWRWYALHFVSLSHARLRSAPDYNHFPSRGNLRAVVTVVYWPSREIIARIYIYTVKRSRFRPQTPQPSRNHLSALNSANVGCFSPLATLNRVSCVNETKRCFRGRICVPSIPTCRPDPYLMHSLITLNPLKLITCCGGDAITAYRSIVDISRLSVSSARFLSRSSIIYTYGFSSLTRTISYTFAFLAFPAIPVPMSRRKLALERRMSFVVRTRLGPTRGPL